jgi:hypothetical protein
MAGGGRLVARVSGDLADLDNRDQAGVELGMHPNHQHQGHGRGGGPTCARDVADAAGAIASLDEVRRTLRLDDPDEVALNSTPT